MAHALRFTPFSTSIELPTQPSRIPTDELRQRAEAIKDRIYRRHVARELDAGHAERWSQLNRHEKLTLVGQVAEHNARRELTQISADADAPFLSHWDLVGEYLRRHGQSASEWPSLPEEEKDRAFFATAVRRFLRQVTDEVLRELRTESWSRAAVPNARA